jgi:hypothetical protein
VIRHLRDSHADRELLAMKVRVLVARVYKRAESRQRLRDAGLEVPESEPGSWEAYEDRVYETLKPRVYRHGKPHLTVLDGGVEDPLAGVAAAGRSDTGQALRHGGKPPLRSGESVAAHPQNFETEETP